VERIRALFDYEVLGGSPLLGVRGTVIITHGRARRRMVKHAIAVGAAAARARVPELIAEALRPIPATGTEAELAAGSMPAGAAGTEDRP